MKTIPLGKKLTIAIDVDGTIADSSQIDFYKVDNHPEELMKAKPIPAAVAAIKKLHKAGHKIVIYSSRNISSRNVTRRWLKKYGFPFHHIVMEKLVAHVYVDDRAINGCDWERVMNDLKHPKLPGKLARDRGMI